MSTALKRDPIKYVRDKVKSNYKKDTECFICGNTENLEFHHFNTLTLLFDTWLRKNKYSIETVNEIEEVRDLFIKDQWDFLVSPEETITLCKWHHTGTGEKGKGKGLHKIYGKAPPLRSAPKQKHWVQTQRDKFYGVV